MGFSEMFQLASGEREGDEPEQQVRPWWGAPEDELGVCVPQGLVIARSDRAVVALSHVVAYSTGAQFELAGKGRGIKQSQVHAMFHAQHFDPDEDVPDELLRIGLEFADGRRVSNLGGRRRPFDEQPHEPVLHPHGGGGGSGNRGELSMRPGYWLWPLPPPGPLRIWCEWPALDVALASVEIDATEIVAAAQLSVSLWD